MALEHPGLAALLSLGRAIQRRVLGAFTGAAPESLAAVAEEGSEGDTQYAIDRIGEEALVEALGADAERLGGVVLVAEGVRGGSTALPAGRDANDCRYRMLVDPIDGTRSLMHQKRSAWTLLGLAPNRGAATRSSHIEVAAQIELPIAKQRLADELFAVRGQGFAAERVNLDTGARARLALAPSRAESIAHGYATVCRLFPGGRSELARLDDALAERLLGPPVAGQAQCFEDQYPSSGGQLYELISGHDRLVADLRPLVSRALAARGKSYGACCHPYDLASALIAEEAGVLLTDPFGAPLDFALDLTTNVAWVGYANRALREQIEPVLGALLREHGLASP